MEGRRVHKAAVGYWLLKPEGQIETEIAERDWWEYGSTPVVQRFVKPGWVVWDIGCNIGWYSVVCGELGARVYAFDPDPDAAHLCRVHMAMNEVDGEVSCATVGEKSFNVVSLDEHTARLDFLKIDTDGDELKIIRGGMRTLERCKPIILLEVGDYCMKQRHNDMDAPEGQYTRELIGLLSGLGYQFVWERGFESLDADRMIEEQRNVGGTLNVFCCHDRKQLNLP